MSCLAVSDNLIALAKGLHIDCFDHSKHKIVDITPKTGAPDGDSVVDIILSSDDKLLAVITALSKELLVFDLPISTEPQRYTLPRSASKIRFSRKNTHILVADKTGDALIYNLKLQEKSGDKILGHLSLLLDIIQTSDEKHIITSDRDEKIRVSCYPNTYNIQTYCLGHKEFVNHIELLPLRKEPILVSTSGDGYIKLWNYVEGKLCHDINTNLEVKDDKLRDNFIKIMDEDGIQVNTLPIVHCAVTNVSETCSHIAVTVHTYNNVLIYSVKTESGQFSHKLKEAVALERFPAAIQFHKSSLYVYDSERSVIQLFKISDTDTLKPEKEIKVFEDQTVVTEAKGYNHDSIKVLYKRKFDNVQEYQERKKQRLEKTQ